MHIHAQLSLLITLVALIFRTSAVETPPDSSLHDHRNNLISRDPMLRKAQDKLLATSKDLMAKARPLIQEAYRPTPPRTNFRPRCNPYHDTTASFNHKFDLPRSGTEREEQARKCKKNCTCPKMEGRSKLVLSCKKVKTQDCAGYCSCNPREKIDRDVSVSSSEWETSSFEKEIEEKLTPRRGERRIYHDRELDVLTSRFRPAGDDRNSDSAEELELFSPRGPRVGNTQRGSVGAGREPDSGEALGLDFSRKSRIEHTQGGPVGVGRESDQGELAGLGPAGVERPRYE
jgi:hypothetical protein